jgi:hypothetical protein
VRQSFSNGETRRPNATIRPAFRNFLSQTNFPQIEGETNWPSEIFFNRRNQFMSEQELQDALFSDIEVNVPSECRNNHAMINMNDTDLIRSLMYEGTGQCLSSEFALQSPYVAFTLLLAAYLLDVSYTCFGRRFQAVPV